MSDLEQMNTSDVCKAKARPVKWQETWVEQLDGQDLTLACTHRSQLEVSLTMFRKLQEYHLLPRV